MLYLLRALPSPFSIAKPQEPAELKDQHALVLHSVLPAAFNRAIGLRASVRALRTPLLTVCVIGIALPFGSFGWCPAT